MLTLVTGYDDSAPLIYRPWDEPFWVDFLKEHGPAKSQPSEEQPVDGSLLANFVDPIVAKMLALYKVAEEIAASRRVSKIKKLRTKVDDGVLVDLPLRWSRFH